MKNLRTGIDLVEIERLESTLERYGARFLQRVKQWIERPFALFTE